MKKLIILLILFLSGCSLITPLSKEDYENFEREKKRWEQQHEEPRISEPQK